MEEAPHGRLRAFGNQLIDVHLWLREELAALRETVDAHLDDDSRLDDVRSRALRAHCLAFCSALDRHHTGEDGGAFPQLGERFPELRPVLQELRRDHRMVEDSLRRLRGLLDRVGRGADPAAVRTELDSLTALMETHYRVRGETDRLGAQRAGPP